MSVMPLLALNPHWLHGRFSLAMVGTIMLTKTLACTLPVMESRDSMVIGAVTLFTIVLIQGYDDDIAKNLVATCPAFSSRPEDHAVGHGALDHHTS